MSASLAESRKVGVGTDLLAEGTVEGQSILL